jgi:hypothetical protein
MNKLNLHKNKRLFQYYEEDVYNPDVLDLQFNRQLGKNGKLQKKLFNELYHKLRIQLIEQLYTPVYNDISKKS